MQNISREKANEIADRTIARINEKKWALSGFKHSVEALVGLLGIDPMNKAILNSFALAMVNIGIELAEPTELSKDLT